MEDRTTTTYTALSDVYGKIDEVLISMKSGGDDDIHRQYDGILNALGGRVHFVLLGQYQPTEGANHTQQSRELKSLRNRLGRAKSFREHQLYIVEPDYEYSARQPEYSGWVADPFTILIARDGTPIFLEPYYFGKKSRGQDQHIAEQVSAYTDYLLKSTRYEFEGGNILVGDDFMLVGRDALITNIERYYPELSPLDGSYERTLHRITEAFERTFGVSFVVWVGEDRPFEIPIVGERQGDGRTQPFYHIDLYLTLAGKTMAGEELVYLAEFGPEDLAMIPEGLKDDWQKVFDALDRVKDFLETYHLNHPGPKFKVERIPMGVRVMPSGKVVPLSMNNCLVEIYSGVKAIYLPEYHSRREGDTAYLSDLRERTEAIVRSNRFHPVWVPGNFYDIAPTYSSLHCLIKILKRSHRAY